MKTYHKNRKAHHDYEILETYEAGVSLTGAEVKAVRNSQINLLGSFISIEDNKIQLKQCTISRPEYLGYESKSFDETRIKFLLLNKKEISKIYKEVQNPGYSIIPLEVYQREGTGSIKIKIAVCKGKSYRDKRNVLKEKTQKIEMDRVIKNKDY